MRTIALRFGEHFSPKCGTIAAHEEIINDIGYVWYGKMGAVVSKNISNEIMSNSKQRILLIRSGKPERYWAYVEKIQYEVPPIREIPSYYREVAGTFKTWFKVSRFELAEKDIMSKCIVTSSGNSLSEVSKHSMSPYFIINDEE